MEFNLKLNPTGEQCLFKKIKHFFKCTNAIIITIKKIMLAEIYVFTMT